MSNPIEVAPPPGIATRGGMREVGALAYPVILAQVSATVMGIVDSAMVGRIGATELGAAGFAGIWTWTCFALLNGTASGVQTFVSQAEGAGSERECGAWGWHATFLLVPLGVLVAALGIAFAGPLVGAAGPSPELREAAETYLQPRLLGMPGLMIAFIWMSFFRGIGDTRTPLWGSLVANLVNAVLDYGLIFGRLGLPEWGIAGAGAATAVGETTYGVFMLVAAMRVGVRRRYQTQPIAPDRKSIRRLLWTGSPIGGQWFLDMIAFALFTTMVARMGDLDMAASQAFVMLLSLSFMQAIGISVASSTLVGRYVGAGDPASAYRSFHSSLRFAGVLAIAIAVLFLAAPELLMRIFSDDPRVIAKGAPLVRLGAFYQLMDAVAIVASGALRGAGDTRWPFLVQSTTAWTLFLPLAYVFGVVLDGGLFAAWSAGGLQLAVLSAALFWRFQSGAWEKISI
ncbi:MAG: MATE family efflux transporter [Myxococcota bacterium]|nr:MATE family efflux transporter [Myxococcota bacterium]